MDSGKSGASGVIPAKQARPVDELVFKGHIIQARLNSGLFIGLASVLWILLVLSLARDIYGNTAGLQAAVHEAQTGHVSWFTRFRANPWQTLKGSVSSEDAAPAIDEGKIFEGAVKDQFDSSKLSTAQDVGTLVADELAALNATQKMSPDNYPCDRLKSLSESWLNSQSKQPDVPRCAYSADGDVIYEMSIVAVGSRSMPWIGVYRRDGDKKWTYFNLRSRAAQSVQVETYEFIEPNMIPRQMAKDFPDLVIKVEPISANKKGGE